MRVVIRRAGKLLPAVTLGVALALLTLAPFARLVWQAMAAAFGPGGPGPLLTVLMAPATRSAAMHSAIVATGGAAIAGVLGGAMALLVGATDMPGGRTLGAAFTLLMVLPAQVTTLAWIALFGPSSPVLQPLGLAPAAGSPPILFGPGGIALLLGVEHAPMVFLVLRAALRAIPPELLAAARGVGAGPLRCLVESWAPWWPRPSAAGWRSPSSPPSATSPHQPCSAFPAATPPSPPWSISGWWRLGRLR